MEQINFSYTLSDEVLDKGVKLSGLFTPAKTRQIILSLLMAFVFANAIYGTISIKELTARNLFYLIASAVIVAILWLEPVLRVKSYKKNTLGKIANIEVERGKITAFIGEEKLNIIGEGLKGFKKAEDCIIIYFAAEYLLLPTADKTQEEIDKVLDYLTNFSTDTQTVKEEQ